MEEESSSGGSSDSESEDDRPKTKDTPGPSIQPPPLPPQADKVIVKKYDPKQGKNRSS